MQNYSPLPGFPSTVKAVDAGNAQGPPGILKTNHSAEKNILRPADSEGFQDFQQVLQASKAHQKSGVVGELSLEELQIQTPVTSLKSDGLGAFEEMTELIEPSHLLALQAEQKADKSIKGQSLSSKAAVSGDSLPPEMPAYIIKNAALSAVGPPSPDSLSGFTSEASATQDQARIVQNGVLENSLAAQAQQSESVGYANGMSKATPFVEPLMKENPSHAGVQVLNPSLSDHAARSRTDSQINIRAKALLHNMGVRTGSLDNAVVKAEQNSNTPVVFQEIVSFKTPIASSTLINSGESGVKTNMFSGQSESLSLQKDAEMRALVQNEYSNTKLSTTDLADMPDVDRSERAALAPAELRTRASGEGLRQYATGIGVNVADPNWGEHLSQKIVWLSGRNIQSAEIQLNPAELGPIEVKISVHNEQTSISFNAQHASVREMLESNIHRLREMMDESGVDLSDVNVASEQQGNSHFTKDSDDQGESPGGSDQDKGIASRPEPEDMQSVVAISSPNMVDYYA